MKSVTSKRCDDSSRYNVYIGPGSMVAITFIWASLLSFYKHVFLQLHEAQPTKYVGVCKGDNLTES